MPNLIFPPELKEIESNVASLKDAYDTALSALDNCKARAEIQCTACLSKYPISSQEYIQKHWYASPSGCTEGDYWNEGEANWVCQCGFRNRFDNKGKERDWLGLHHPEIVALKSKFGSVRDCYCDWHRKCDRCSSRKEWSVE